MADLPGGSIPNHAVIDGKDVVFSVNKSLGTNDPKGDHIAYSSLQTICKSPGIDQGTLAKTIGFDTSTIGNVIDRLESHGLVKREISPTDKRARQVTATPEGEQLLAKVVPPMLGSQDLFLEPLPLKERKEFMRLMHQLLEAHAAKGRGYTLPQSE